MQIWTNEIKEIERLYETVRGRFTELEKELNPLVRTSDANVLLLYSRRCLEVIITDLCQCELKRPRKTEPLKSIIDKLNREEKVPSHIITSMEHLNSLAVYGAHPKDFDREQVKPVLINLAVIIKWYLRYKDPGIRIKPLPDEKPADTGAKPAADKTSGKTKRITVRSSAGLVSKSLARFIRKLRLKFSLPTVLILALAIFLVFSSGSTLPFSKRDWILISDFENLTDNQVFDKSLYTAFSLTTSQSRYVNVFPRSRMLETLAMMEIKDQTDIDAETGREMAIRQGINLYITPSISKVGDRFAITAKILETGSGNLLKSEILYAETQNDILPALDKLSRKLRRSLGESIYDIVSQDKPLATVTTSSLEALKLYSHGIDQHFRLDFKGAREYYENALKIDTGFTSAKASLGGILYEKYNEQEKGRKLLEEAVRSADKLIDREKYAILSYYAVNVEKDLKQGIENTKILTKLYPDDAGIHHNLGYYYQSDGQYEEALQEYKAAIHLNPAQALTYTGILWIYLEYLGEADSLLAWSGKMIADNPQNAWGYMYQGAAWFMMDSLDKAEAAYIKSREIYPDLSLTLFNLSHTYRLMERYDDAVNILKHILEIYRNEIAAYYGLGVVSQSMGKTREADEYFTAFKKYATDLWIKWFPDNAGTYTALAAVTARLGDMDSSKLMLQKAIEIDSTQHVSFAEVLCLHGNVNEALKELKKGLEKGYRNLYELKASSDLQILHYDIRYRNLLAKYFK
ncbi:MAG: tetratricopeptide repeat protein [Bacteroidales bacterium]|nr:tetratricopeptide repeat protein [Bacteroidales bacterium]